MIAKAIRISISIQMVLYFKFLLKNKETLE